MELICESTFFKNTPYFKLDGVITLQDVTGVTWREVESVKTYRGENRRYTLYGEVILKPEIVAKLNEITGKKWDTPYSIFPRYNIEIAGDEYRPRALTRKAREQYKVDFMHDLEDRKQVAVDEALDWFTDYIRKEFAKLNKDLMRRVREQVYSDSNLDNIIKFTNVDTESEDLEIAALQAKIDLLKAKQNKYYEARSAKLVQACRDDLDTDEDLGDDFKALCALMLNDEKLKLGIPALRKLHF